MKYYNAEYWLMMNSDNPLIRDQGDTAWVESAKKYASYFESIQDNLPKRFLKSYNQADRFHDYMIDSVALVNAGKYTSAIEFKIRRDQAVYKLLFNGVKRYLVDIPSTRNWMSGILTWGYAEFELDNDRTWIIRILCDLECEIEIHFKHISIREIT
jgi:hypothetical protein